MLDQTFSAENFHKISEIKKRHKRASGLKFFPKVEKKTDYLISVIKECKDFKKNITGKYSAREQEMYEHFRDAREAARNERDEQLLECLKDVAKNISKKSYSIEFGKLVGPGKKPVYCLNKDEPEHYYAEKQISRNINKLYKVKQANRNQIVSQLADLVCDGFPYHFIRTDVSNFYESIDHSWLIKKLQNDQLLSHMSLRLTKNLLAKFSKLTGQAGLGLPRGIGLSAYLAELYMRDFDEEVRSLEDVVFYARYVDDIVVVFAPTPMSKPKEYMKKIEEALEKKGLSKNSEKTIESEFDINNNSLYRSGLKFDYLGYEFVFESTPKILLSNSKKHKYEARLQASFTRYNLQRAKDSKKAYRLLLKRVRFLTGNTQLTHNKGNAFVGIYFSNPHLTDLCQLKWLDGRLKGLTWKVPSKKLKAKLGELSFFEGYKQKIFRRFHKKNEFSEIIKAWKYDK